MAKHALEQVVFYITLWSHHYAGHARKHYGSHQICLYSVENDNNLWFELHKWRPSWVLAVLKYIKYFPITLYHVGHTCIFWTYHFVGRTRKPHGRHQNHESATILKNDINLLFDLEYMAAILNFTLNTMS